MNDGDVIFDVGANIGMFSLSLMKRFSDLRIYSFEPVPGTYACLARNVAESPMASRHVIKTLNVGLGANDRQTTIEFFPRVPSNSTLYSADKHRDFGRVVEGVRWVDEWQKNRFKALLLAPLFPFFKRSLGRTLDRKIAQSVSLPCQIRTVSGIIHEHRVQGIDLLKIDVEGAEMDVFAGIEESHWPLIRQVCMEVEPANKRHVPELLERFRSRGFTRLAVESLLGGACRLEDAVACTVFAVRS